MFAEHLGEEEALSHCWYSRLVGGNISANYLGYCFIEYSKHAMWCNLPTHAYHRIRVDIIVHLCMCGLKQYMCLNCIKFCHDLPPQNGQVKEALESLLALEKQTRLVSYVCVAMTQPRDPSHPGV